MVAEDSRGKGDAARRFVESFLDAGVENPSERNFERDLQSDVMRDRDAILADVLTIWRWGRQNKALRRGIPVGGFEQWGSWARDPLVALGCMDAAITMQRSKESDPGRERGNQCLSRLVGSPQGRARHGFRSR